jgi:hypothetical protein
MGVRWSIGQAMSSRVGGFPRPEIPATEVELFHVSFLSGLSRFFIYRLRCQATDLAPASISSVAAILGLGECGAFPVPDNRANRSERSPQ